MGKKNKGRRRVTEHYFSPRQRKHCPAADNALIDTRVLPNLIRGNSAMEYTWLFGQSGEKEGGSVERLVLHALCVSANSEAWEYQKDKDCKIKIRHFVMESDPIVRSVRDSYFCVYPSEGSDLPPGRIMNP